MATSSQPTTLTIGKVARRAGLAVETIRFYERERLLPEPARDPSSGYRRYPQSTVDRLKFIARAKELERDLEALLLAQLQKDDAA